jgi:hypothetical protein
MRPKWHTSFYLFTEITSLTYKPCLFSTTIYMENKTTLNWKWEWEHRVERKVDWQISSQLVIKNKTERIFVIVYTLHVY